MKVRTGVTPVPGKDPSVRAGLIRTGHRWAITACVFAVFGLGGCLGESSVGDSAPEKLLAIAGESDSLDRMQGRWTADVTLGEAGYVHVFEIVGSVMTARDQDGKMYSAPVDVLESAETWVRLLVMHDDGFVVQTLRFASDSELWFEHHPDVRFRRDIPRGAP